MKYVFLTTAIVISSFAFAQKKKSTPATPAETFQPEMYKGLKWRNIGPLRGGRSNAVAGVPNNDQLYYVGYTGGGLWKTEDGGLSWKSIGDAFLKTGSVGDIAVAPSDPNVIVVGMGEHAVRGVMTTYGDGVYLSTDAGKTWKNIGLEKTRHISDVIIHPNNPEIIWVAAQGTVHGPSTERGIYKTTDGGKTWKKTLYVDENTGASSLSIDPTNSRILFAATWQHKRYPWKVESGGAGCGIWKSVDGGETWQRLSEGLPKEMGKIGVSVSAANPQRVFAIVEAEKSKAGLYRSDDGGKKWNLLSNDANITSRSWYYMEVAADPKNADVVYVLNSPLTKSIDGGKTFQTIRVGHIDTHDLWINPNNTQNMILGDDGGAEITFNGGKTWSTQMNQPTSQFYRVNVDNQFPFNVYGGQQDNTSVVTKSRNNGFSLTERDWFEGPGCESATIAFDPNNPHLLYGGCYQGIIGVLDVKTGEQKDIMQYPATNLAYKAKDMKYRFNWNAPILASPHNPNVIYHAGNVVFKSTNGGINWEKISPDLTRNDTTKQQVGGGPLTNEGAGGENYNTIYYLIESPHQQGVLYAGSDCGLIHVTMDGGKNWQNITPKDLPESSVHAIEVSPHDPATVYVAATRYKFSDYASYTYRSSDYGKTWTKINNGIEADDFIKVIREDRKSKGLLYAGAERGFYVSFNAGNQWHKLMLNLPVVPITDLAMQGNDLVASTAGRAFWILDDLSALQQSQGKFTESVKLFSPKTTVRYPGVTVPEEAQPVAGQNPMDGVILDYYLKDKADTATLTLEIYNQDGKLIRKFSNKKDENFKGFPGGPPAPQLLPAEAGVNRFAWDLRTETLLPINNAFVYGDYRGHRVAPGKYKAVLKHKGITSEATCEVVADPNLKVTASDWSEQQQFLYDVAQQIEKIHRAVNNMRQVKKQIEAQQEVLKQSNEATTLLDAGKALVKKIDGWESEVVESRQKNFQDVINYASKLNVEFFALRGAADVHDPRLTQGVKDRYADLLAQWQKAEAKQKQIVAEDVKAYNDLFKKLNLDALIIKN
ncbi:MAG: glycosyl hydrolase [Cyclobacteriaceae bacterium]|jgi:photosystem II stability/assembly factor-like uncharacterized protein|nr:glycosyl hydrolase [Cytophagales bacterium]MCZ8328510.1 glycosyl hydrolase [Cyclobacteriaceae bacterium]